LEILSFFSYRTLYKNFKYNNFEEINFWNILFWKYSKLNMKLKYILLIYI
jgi:hypothetical protein